jgi:hypothetical protein
MKLLPKIAKSFKGAVISDVHLGHRKTSTEHSITTLKQMLPNNAATGELDIIFISGDFFDRILSAASDDYILICEYISFLLRICKNRNIILRCLEGTPSHDYKQAKIFDIFNEVIGANFKYAETLEYEYIDELGIDVIYIPDEFRHNAEDTRDEVLALMERNQITSVAYVIMHGMCTYQAPAHRLNSSMHDHEFYNSIVRINTYCGHVHQNSNNGSFNVPGSTERYCFGDETDKGHLRFSVIDGIPTNTFVINHNSKIYKYIKLSKIDDLSEEDLSDLVMNQAKVVICDYPLDSNFRYRVNSDREIGAYVEQVVAKYPGMNWDWENSSKDTDTQTLPKIREHVNKESAFTITKDNIVKLVSDELVEADKNISKQVLEVLKGIVDEYRT